MRPAARFFRWLAIGVAAVVLVLLALFMLDQLDLLHQGGAEGTSSMAPTLPPCNGRTIAEGITYRFRDPRRGEIVAIHARGKIGELYHPDPDSRQLTLNKRIIGIPGDTVTGHDGRVVVNGRTDNIETNEGFSAVRLGPDEYFVLGDNRSSSQDSRVFGPVPRDAIFARVVLVYWPVDRFGVPGYDRDAVPPGSACGQG